MFMDSCVLCVQILIYIQFFFSYIDDFDIWAFYVQYKNHFMLRFFFHFIQVKHKN